MDKAHQLKSELFVTLLNTTHHWHVTVWPGAHERALPSTFALTKAFDVGPETRLLTTSFLVAAYQMKVIQQPCSIPVMENSSLPAP